jgi:hypothetical protein
LLLAENFITLYAVQDFIFNLRHWAEVTYALEINLGEIVSFTLSTFTCRCNVVSYIYEGGFFLKMRKRKIKSYVKKEFYAQSLINLSFF